MNLVNLLVLSLVGVLTLVLALVLLGQPFLTPVAEHPMAFIFAIGAVGLVGAREQTAS